MGIADKRRDQIFDTVAKTRFPIIILIMLCSLGTLGFMFIEGAPPFDSLYMTIITIATVGYGEIIDLSNTGRAFAAFLIISGAVTYIYAITLLISLVFDNNLIGNIKELRLERYVTKHLKDHFILVGFTKTSREVARSFLNREIPFVIIEANEDLVKMANAFGCPLVLHLDRFSVDSLRRANIEKCRGVIVALESDEENISVTASVRVVEEELGRDLMVISTALQSNAIAKLRAVGADYVLSPASLIGKKIAALATNPPASGHTSGLLESIVVGDHPMYESREVKVDEHSPFWGKSLKDLQLRNKFGVTVIAGVRSNGEIDMLPYGDYIFDRTGSLVIMGPREAMHDFLAFYHEGQTCDLT